MNTISFIESSFTECAKYEQYLKLPAGEKEAFLAKAAPSGGGSTDSPAAGAAAEAPAATPSKLFEKLMAHGDGELLDLVAAAMLALDLPSVLRLSQACTALRGQLAAARAAAEARRLRWVEELTVMNAYNVSNEGRTLTMKNVMATMALAVGPLLPTTGRFSFSVRIEQAHKSHGFMAIGVGGLSIGVCGRERGYVSMEACSCGWALFLYDGTLMRDPRSPDGEMDEGPPGDRNTPPPPEGWPDGHNTQVLFDEAGQPASLKGRATGAVIKVIVDHSDGSLSFGVNAAPPRRVPEGWPTGYDPDDPPPGEPPAKVPFKFPQGAQLRPWATQSYPHDRVSFALGHLVLDE